MNGSSALRAGALFLIGMGAHCQIFSADAAFGKPVEPRTPALTANPLTRPLEPAPGRLFFAPERRLALDQQRVGLRVQKTVVEGETLTLNGVVTRSSGKWTAWVNGNAVTEKDTSSVAVTLIPGQFGQGQLSTGNAGEVSRTVSVGNSVDRATGITSSSLGTGSVRVHSRSTAR